MGFIGSAEYYALCGISLVALLIGLIVISKQKSSSPQKEHSEQSLPSGHAPKYAAGGEMDRINKNAYVMPRRKRSIVSLVLAVIALAGTVFLYTRYNTLVPVPKALPVINQIFNTGSEIVDTKDKELKSEIKSADYSQDLSKIFVTLALSNETDITFYAISPTLSLKDKNDNILQSEEIDIIDHIDPDGEKEITTAINIDPENIGKTAGVGFYIHYYKQKP